MWSDSLKFHSLQQFRIQHIEPVIILEGFSVSIHNRFWNRFSSWAQASKISFFPRRAFRKKSFHKNPMIQIQWLLVKALGRKSHIWIFDLFLFSFFFAVHSLAVCAGGGTGGTLANDPLIGLFCTNICVRRIFLIFSRQCTQIVCISAKPRIHV